MSTERSLKTLIEGYNPWWADPSARRPTQFRDRREATFQVLLRGAIDPTSLSVTLHGPPHRVCFFDVSDAAATSSDRSTRILDLILAAW